MPTRRCRTGCRASRASRSTIPTRWRCRPSRRSRATPRVPPSAVIRFANALGYRRLPRSCSASTASGWWRARRPIASASSRCAQTRRRPGDRVLPQLVDTRDRRARAPARAPRAAARSRRAAALRRSGRRGVHVLAQRRAFPVAAYLAYGAGAARDPRAAARQRRRHAATSRSALIGRERPADRGELPQLLAGSGRGGDALPQARRAGDRVHRPRR